jgi:transcriptional regulator with XRE-family HTH domain
MHELIKGARERAGLTQATVARAVHMSISNYQRYENGVLPLNTDLVVKLSRILNRPTLTMVWCRKGCDIGRLYCFEILNNVDLNPTAILTKYRQEEREAHEALENMALLFLNKKGAADCTDAELRELYHWALEMLDIEHVVETLKMRLWDFMDVEELVRDHNRKVVDKHYYDPKKPDLQLAG